MSRGYNKVYICNTARAGMIIVIAGAANRTRAGIRGRQGQASHQDGSSKGRHSIRAAYRAGAKQG